MTQQRERTPPSTPEILLPLCPWKKKPQFWKLLFCGWHLVQATWAVKFRQKGHVLCDKVWAGVAGWQGIERLRETFECLCSQCSVCSAATSPVSFTDHKHQNTPLFSIDVQKGSPCQEAPHTAESWTTTKKRVTPAGPPLPGRTPVQTSPADRPTPCSPCPPHGTAGRHHGHSRPTHRGVQVACAG